MELKKKEENGDREFTHSFNPLLPPPFICKFILLARKPAASILNSSSLKNIHLFF